MRYGYVAVETGEVPLSLLCEAADSMWNCIGLDPGGATGWCVLQIYEIAMQVPDYRILENVAAWSAGEVKGSIERQVDKLVDLVDAWPDAEVVCEDFLLRQMAGGRDLLDPIRITSPLKWWLECGGRRAWDVEEGEDWKPRELHLQQPALAMSTITDARLRAFGILDLTARQPHARDAMRHALTFARRRKSLFVANGGDTHVE